MAVDDVPEFGKAVDEERAAASPSLGVGKGDQVAIIANNRVEWAVGAYATYGLGAACVPMYEQQLEKDWEFIVKRLRGEGPLRRERRPSYEQDASGFLEVDPDARSTSSCSRRAGRPTARGRQGRRSRYQALLDPRQGVRRGRRVQLRRRPTSRGSSTRAARRGTPRASSSRTRTSRRTSARSTRSSPLDGTTARCRFSRGRTPSGRPCELHALFSAGASMALAEAVDKIIDNLAEVQPTLLFSVPRIFNKIYTAVQKQIATKPQGIQVVVEAGAPKRRASSRAGRRVASPSALRDRGSPTGSSSPRCARGSAGGSSTPSAAARPSRARWPSSSTSLGIDGLRRVRPHRDEPHRDGQLPGRAAASAVVGRAIPGVRDRDRHVGYAAQRKERRRRTADRRRGRSSSTARTS